ncbi:serine/threonine-protein kinase [Phycicoccus sp.]|uniref:serine/threonine-protein kinase n=1 Tax=Phycicoccus sp. TaxID=1902410 RepID=UPI002B71979B|nr:serine/threonine-protein kinase [Phycicoccus sp.]HMM96556.1 serine/threonine-protein kinase [Phycicoccus sp.]
MNRLQPDYCLGERYRLISRIASGGMGDVWRADDTVLDRTVAVKVLRPSTDAEPVFVRRFRDEALYTAALSHPNIASLYDYGEEDTLAFLVMELVEGEPLSEVVRREGPLPTEQVRGIVAQAALALGAAHEAGVVHRDVKPANILLTPDGVVKLTDFGIARAVDGSAHTQTGEIVGTPHYLSPEQALGEPATGASDLYALGIVAHEMLTGRRPFDRNTPVATALAQVNDPPPPLPDHVTGTLRTLVEQCLEKRPEARPVSARELGERLGLPESELGEAGRVAAEVVGTAARAESAQEALTDPTPTPEAPAVRARRFRRERAGSHAARADAPHVHWAWVPATGIVAAVLVALARGLGREQGGPRDAPREHHGPPRR